MLLLSCITGAARANGRFPQAQAIESTPGRGDVLFLRTTFGILVSRDAGLSWQWICERALGYEGQWDPPIAVTRDGRLWVGLPNGLASTADGCAVDFVPELAGETIKDLTVDARGDVLYAIVGAPGKRAAVFRKKDRWERLASKGLDDLNLLTIEVAPTRDTRIYVSGEPYDTVRGRLYRSDDGGQSFSGTPNALAAEGPFFIAAVDAEDPNRLVLRHLHAAGSDLLLTTDAGKTFQNVLAMKSAMFGFAKGKDKKTFFAASGLAADGVFRSTDRGATFQRVSSHGVLCLHGNAAGLFACENVFALGGPAIAASADDGASFRSLARFADIKGPISCGPSASNDAGARLCGDAWAETLASVSPRPDAGAPPAIEDAGAVPSPPKPKSSCSCRVGGASNAPDPTWLIAVSGPLSLRWRRRARMDRRVTKPTSSEGL